MRKLMLFTIGFIASLVCCVYLLDRGYWYLIIPIGLCLIVGILLLKRQFKFWKESSVILLGCVIGAVSLLIFDSIYLAPVRNYDGQTVSASMVCTDYSYETDYGSAVDGKIELEGKVYSIRIYTQFEEELCPGDCISGKFRLRYTSLGGQQGTTYHQGEGTFFLAYEEADVTVSKVDKVPMKYFAAKLRFEILKILDNVFPDDTEAFARALLLGDSSKLTFKEDNAFKISGIRHIIAVSGLHVSILFSLIYISAGKRRFMTAFIGIPVLFIFAAIAGFTPSVVRACIMQGLLIIALLLNREYDPPTALAFAVLVMLLINPLAVTSVSLQLSAGCMVGIFLFSSKISNFLLDEKRLGPAKGKSLKARVARWFAGSVSVSFSTMITTMPLCAYYFGMVSIIGVLTNLLTLWVVSFIFYGIMLSCVIGAVWATVGQWIAWSVSWLIRYVIWISDLLSNIPFAAIYTYSSYTVFWLVFAYVLLILFFVIKKKKPVIFVCCLCVSLFVSIFASWLEPRLGNYRMTTLDVGQGQCILLQSKGKNYLVDCGGEREETVASDLLKLLYSQGVHKLDAIILTHFDEDHAGSIQLLLSEISTDTVYITTPDPETDIDDMLLKTYPDICICVTEMTKLTSDNSQLTIYPAQAGKTGNESSLCVLFQAGNCDILITGDRTTASEKTLISQYSIPEVDILVAGHHGAKSSTGFALLSNVKPSTVVISVGTDNSYGHPDEEVLKRLEMFGCKIYRTDQNGTIVFRG